MSEEELKQVIYKDDGIAGEPRYDKVGDDLKVSPPEDLSATVRGASFEVTPEMYAAARKRLLERIKPSQAGTPGDARGVKPDFNLAENEVKDRRGSGERTEDGTWRRREGPREGGASDLKEAARDARHAKGDVQTDEERSALNRIADRNEARRDIAVSEQAAEGCKKGAQRAREELAGIEGDGKAAEKQRRRLQRKAAYLEGEAKRSTARAQAARERLAAAEEPDGRSAARRGWDNVDKQADIVGVGVRKSKALATFGDVTDLETPMGKIEGKTTAGEVAANANFGVGFDDNGLNIAASGKVEGNLFKSGYELKILDETTTFLGEQIGGKLYLKVAGSVGAEAEASVMANLGDQKKLVEEKDGLPAVDPAKVMEGTDLEVDPATGKASPKKEKAGRGISGTASAGAFAGAKLSLGVGAAVEWKKKDSSQYRGKLKDAASALIDLISVVAAGGVGGAGLSWVLHQLDAEEVAEWALDELFTWGKPGTIPLIGAEGMVEGSAGIGAKALAQIGFTGSKFIWNTHASVTWGLGLGTQVQVQLDALEGAKFALLVLGELRAVAQQYLSDTVSTWVPGEGSLLDSLGIVDWVTADDKVREMVANKAHTVANAKERATMMKTLMDGDCGKEDEAAIVRILDFSYNNGDLGGVLANGGGAAFLARIRSKIDDDENAVRQANAFLKMSEEGGQFKILEMNEDGDEFLQPNVVKMPSATEVAKADSGRRAWWLRAAMSSSGRQIREGALRVLQTSKDDGTLSEVLDKLGERRVSALRRWGRRDVRALVPEPEEGPSLMEQMRSDDKIRDLVAKGGHTEASPSHRMFMIVTLMDGACLDEDEAAICKILEDSDIAGDLTAVLAAGGGKEFVRQIRWKVDGAEAERLERLPLD